ncbi:hypothetical protein TWF730_001568 [Orbilia blumenaviensis]|uniref:Yeast cell wall synthesis Kre9/Knh1-like N-terminal domain-containing protein n=1 Tax=Orbilia blumenaviensis TaxID=1796055 RepID=A0AAV9ULM3_9PEZI
MQFRNLFTLLLSAMPLALATDLNNNAITDPIAGDVITAGKPYSIKWTNIKGDSVTLDLVDGPANQVRPIVRIAGGISNSGVYTWSVPDDIPPSETYAIRITYNNNPADYNYSDRFTFENEAVVSSAAVSSSAETSSASASTTTDSASSSKTESEASATTTESESESASSTVASTESETTSSAASSETESVTSSATETTVNTRASSTTVSRATRTSPAVETDMAPVDQPSSASRFVTGQSLIAAIAGMMIGGVFILY